MMKRVAGAVFLIFLCGCKTAGTQQINSGNNEDTIKFIARSLMEQLSGDKNSISVLPFPASDNKKYYKLSYYLNDELITAMYKNKNGNTKIVERSQIEKLLKEANFNLSGMVSTDTAVEIGKLVGVKTLAIGTLSVMKTSVRINARLVDVGTGEVIAVENGDIQLDSNLKSMLEASESAVSVVQQKDQQNSVPEIETNEDSGKDTVWTKVTDDFELTLTSVERKGSKIWAYFKVVYQGIEDEKWLGFKWSKIIDPEGNIYEPVSGGVIQPWDDWGGVTCPGGIPIKVKIPYKVGNRVFDTLSLLQLTFRAAGGRAPDKLYYKNIPVAQH